MGDFLAVDPGLRTGVSLVSYSQDAPAVLLSSWDVPEGVDGFIRWYVENEPATLECIVYEDFILREGKHGVDLTPLKVIGALHVLAFELEIPLHPQPPGGRLKAVSDEVLEKFGMHHPGKQHRNEKESSRHAIWFLKRTGHVPTIRKGWPPN